MDSVIMLGEISLSMLVLAGYKEKMFASVGMEKV